MPRRRKPQKIDFPPRMVQIPIEVLLNTELKDSAFRLYALVTALSYKTGSCGLNDTQLAGFMNCSRQYVSRLLGALSANDLVADTTLDNGQRQLTVAHCDLDTASLVGPRLFEPVGDDLAQAPPYGGRASRPSTPPYGSFCATSDNIKPQCATGSNTQCATSDNINVPVVVVVESINDRESTTTTTAQCATDSNINGLYVTGDNIKPVYVTGDNINGGMSTSDNLKPLIDADFATVSARWVRYFGDITAVEADLLGDLLDDPELAEAAQAAGETAAVWVQAAVEETALAKARSPVKYFRKIMSIWMGQKRRQKDDHQQPGNHQPGPGADYRHGGGEDEQRQRAELERQIAELEAGGG